MATGTLGTGGIGTPKMCWFYTELDLKRLGRTRVTYRANPANLWGRRHDGNNNITSIQFRVSHTK